MAVLTGVITCATATTAAGQPQTSLASMTRLKGQLAYLLDTGGRETLVRVIDASDAELVATVGGVETRFPASQIRRIAIFGRDSVKNGVLIGAGVGFIWGGLAAAADDTQRYPPFVGALIGAGFIGVIGGWIDMRRDGRTTVYQSP